MLFSATTNVYGYVLAYGYKLIEYLMMNMTFRHRRISVELIVPKRHSDPLEIHWSWGGAHTFDGLLCHPTVQVVDRVTCIDETNPDRRLGIFGTIALVPFPVPSSMCQSTTGVKLSHARSDFSSNTSSLCQCQIGHHVKNSPPPPIAYPSTTARICLGQRIHL